MGQGVPAEMTLRRPATVPVGSGAEQRTVLTLARADPDFSAVSAARQPGFLSLRLRLVRPPGLASQGKDW